MSVYEKLDSSASECGTVFEDPKNQAKAVGADGILTHSETLTNIRVMKRTGENIVWVLLK